MTPEKWKEMMEEPHYGEKPFLFLYRAFLVHPWWVYGFFVAFCVAAFFNAYSTLESGGETLAVFVFLVGIGPLFFFFGMKFGIWFCLRCAGFPADYLKLDSRSEHT